MNPAQLNLIELAGMALIVLAVAWLVFGRRKKVRQRYRTPDALDEGVGPAARNQALIDAPSARLAALAGSGPDLGGLGDLIAAGAAEEVAISAPATAAPGPFPLPPAPAATPARHHPAAAAPAPGSATATPR